MVGHWIDFLLLQRQKSPSHFSRTFQLNGLYRRVTKWRTCTILMMYTCGHEESLLLPWHFQERFYLLKKSAEREIEAEIEKRHWRFGPKADFKNTGMIRGKEMWWNKETFLSFAFRSHHDLHTMHAFFFFFKLTINPYLSFQLSLRCCSSHLIPKPRWRNDKYEVYLWSAAARETEQSPVSTPLSPFPEPSPGLRGTLFLLSFFSEIGTFTRRSIRRSGAARHWR